MNEALYRCTNLNAIYSTAVKLRLCKSMSAKLFIVDGNKVKSVKHTHTHTYNKGSGDDTLGSLKHYSSNRKYK